MVALAGNPNTGKSTIFNALTSLHQHTGNWPGKTVTNTQGKFSFKEHNYIVVDLPGTYSLLASSVEKIIARDNKGIEDLKNKIAEIDLGKTLLTPRKIKYQNEIQYMIKLLSPKLKEVLGSNINNDWLALRLLDGDKSMLNSISNYLNIDLKINSK